MTLPLDLPRTRKRRVMMRVSDAGNGCAGDRVIQFKCARCGYDTGWFTDQRTVTENQRGLPCPRCNANGEEAKR